MEQDLEKTLERKYFLLTCHDYQTVSKIITKEEKSKLKGRNIDVRLDLTTGEGFIRLPNGKEIIKPVIGPEGWDLLKKLFKRGGESVKLRSQGYMAARIYRLRKIFHDTNEYFFVTQRNPFYAVRLNPKRIWQIIVAHEPEPKSASKSQE